MRVLKWFVPLVIAGVIVYAVATSYRNWTTIESIPKMTVPACSIRVNVLNASGKKGAAEGVADTLGRAGFDVYDRLENDEVLLHTRIVDRRDPGLKFAREFRKFMTVPARKFGPFRVSPRFEPEISARVDSLLYLEVTLILGSDYRKFLDVAPRPF